MAARAWSRERLIVKRESSGQSFRRVECAEKVALVQAVMDGNKDLVRSLLASGADIHEYNANDINALGAACRTANVKMVELLLENGADIYM